MRPKPGRPGPGAPGREIGEGYKYVSLGMTFAGGVIVFMAAGFWLDRWLGVMPLFTIVGTLGGAALSFLNIYRKLQADEAKRRAERENQRPRP